VAKSQGGHLFVCLFVLFFFQRPWRLENRGLSCLYIIFAEAVAAAAAATWPERKKSPRGVGRSGWVVCKPTHFVDEAVEFVKLVVCDW